MYIAPEKNRIDFSAVENIATGGTGGGTGGGGINIPTIPTVS